jgi:hypothetical protein
VTLEQLIARLQELAREVPGDTRVWGTDGGIGWELSEARRVEMGGGRWVIVEVS